MVSLSNIIIQSQIPGKIVLLIITQQIASEICINIHGPQRIIPDYFHHLLTFYLDASSGLNSRCKTSSASDEDWTKKNPFFAPSAFAVSYSVGQQTLQLPAFVNEE